MINKIKLVVLTSLCIVSFNLYAQYGPSTAVQGGFCSTQNGAPVPGLMVSLVHPQLGRSTPSYTNQYGYFQMFNIPLHGVPYYIEVYWGQRLIFRSQIMVQGPLNLPMQCI
jgi:hypothetical protein